MKQLLECSSIDVNVLGTGDSSPLDMAKQGGHQKIASMLEERGATELGKSKDLIQSVVASMYGKGMDPFGEAVRRRIAELSERFVGRGG